MLATWRSGYATVCKTVYAGSIPAVASTTTAFESSPCKHRPLRRRFVGAAHRVGVPHRDCVTCDRDAAEVAVSRVDIAVAGPANGPSFSPRELARKSCRTDPPPRSEPQPG